MNVVIRQRMYKDVGLRALNTRVTYRIRTKSCRRYSKESLKFGNSYYRGSIGLRVWDSGLGFGVLRLECRVWGFGLQGLGRLSSIRCIVPGIR